MTKQAIANPPMTLTAEALQKVIAQAIAEHEAAKAIKAKSDTSAEMDALVIRNFKRAGFGQVIPRVDTKTFGKWVEEGLRPKEGEHAIKCKSLRLFHASQTEPISEKEKAALLAEREAKKAAKTSDRLPPVSPIAPPAKPAKTASKTVIIAPGKVGSLQ
jgi:hypothetical protein